MLFISMYIYVWCSSLFLARLLIIDSSVPGEMSVKIFCTLIGDNLWCHSTLCCLLLHITGKKCSWLPYFTGLVKC